MIQLEPLIIEQKSYLRIPASANSKRVRTSSKEQNFEVCQGALVSSVRESGLLGAGVSHARSISGFVHDGYVYSVVNFQLWIFFRVDRCVDLGSNPVKGVECNTPKCFKGGNHLKKHFKRI